MRNLGIGTAKRPIKGILVFKDPGDWYLDLQIMTDVILGGEYPFLLSVQSVSQHWAGQVRDVARPLKRGCMHALQGE